MQDKRSFAFSSFRTQRVTFFLLALLLGLLVYLERNTLKKAPIDLVSLDTELQNHIDSLKLLENKEQIFSFNPNYISLSKGYALGLSLDEIKRLHKFRELGKFANSIEEFKVVTQVSSSWILKYSPFFKFPKWVLDKELEKKKTTVRKIKDINKATAKELMLIHGIGAVFSNRIVKYRERVGGFDLINQLHQVYGLDSLVVSKIEEKYQVLIPPKRDKIALAEVTLKYLFEIPFLSRNEAKKIITLRTKNKNISLKSLQDQAVLDSLKIERLALYLY